jgi:N-formylglutamate deformylase
VFFSIAEPRGAMTPVVVEVPHAGLEVDALALATLAAPARSLAQDADLYVDELYTDAPDEGAALLVSHVSRYVCDLNRSETDVDAQAVEGGRSRSAPHGVIWRATTENRPALVAPLSRAEYERRLELIYRPYHAALTRLITERVAHFGYAIVLCAHSMPSQGRDGHTDPGANRADVVPGSRGRTSAAGVIIDLPETLARKRHWTVTHDEPYRGGYSTANYGRPRNGVHALQVELSRRLYMDEQQLSRKPNYFEEVRGFCRELVAELGALPVKH